MELKVSELRIGNYVNMLATSIGWFEGQIDIQSLIELDKSNMGYEPILLTEEWFLKCSNLEKTKEGRFMFMALEYYTIDVGGSLYFDGSYTATDINYVHQFQNLYFALTGEELTIK